MVWCGCGCGFGFRFAAVFGFDDLDHMAQVLLCVQHGVCNFLFVMRFFGSDLV